MKKTIIKHILFILSIITFICFVWILFLCNFFSYNIKKATYNTVVDSGQMLTEVVSKDFIKDKFKKFFLDLERNREIFDFTIYTNESVKVADNKTKSFIMSIFKLSFPIKKEGKILGHIDIWPSHELFLSIFTKSSTIMVVFGSLVCLFFVCIVLSYIYTKKYIFLPMSCIENMVDNISGNRKIYSSIPNISLWNGIFNKIIHLQDHVIDIKTTTKLLLSATNINSADVEFFNSVYIIFELLQSKLAKTAECILFLPSESGVLKIAAKDSFFNDSVNSIQSGADSSVWECYSMGEAVILEDLSYMTEYDAKFFKNENLVRLANIPLTGGTDKKTSIGVLTIGFHDEDYFSPEVLDTLRNISKYFSALMTNIEEYNKLKASKRDAEYEIKSLSDELVNVNSIMIQKIRNMKVVFDISSYSSSKFNLEEIVEHAIDRIVDVLDVETAGIYMYNPEKNTFSSVVGSFGIKKTIEFENNKDTVSNRAMRTKQSVILTDEKEFEKYPGSKSLESYFNLSSMILSPIKNEDGVLAVLVAVNKVHTAFSEEDKKTIEQIAIVMAGIIKKIKLYNNLKDGLK